MRAERHLLCQLNDINNMSMLYEMFEEEQCLKYIEVKWVRLQKYFFFYFLLYKRYLVLINILKNGVVDEDEDFF